MLTVVVLIRTNSARRSRNRRPATPGTAPRRTPANAGACCRSWSPVPPRTPPPSSVTGVQSCLEKLMIPPVHPVVRPTLQHLGTAPFPAATPADPSSPREGHQSVEREGIQIRVLPRIHRLSRIRDLRVMYPPLTGIPERPLQKHEPRQRRLQDSSPARCLRAPSSRKTTAAAPARSGTFSPAPRTCRPSSPRGTRRSPGPGTPDDKNRTPSAAADPDTAPPAAEVRPHLERPSLTLPPTALVPHPQKARHTPAVRCKGLHAYEVVTRCLRGIPPRVKPAGDSGHRPQPQPPVTPQKRNPVQTVHPQTEFHVRR
jgi:hypothetical protein